MLIAVDTLIEGLQLIWISSKEDSVEARSHLPSFQATVGRVGQNDEEASATTSCRSSIADHMRAKTAVLSSCVCGEDV
jgi:hypothetical protein